ncbi:5553_t:CDS:2 [Racocetra fulgida]|uniref:5553_t:CDS:1 n=1 Tax=Racocetra fulgida TaxID=60492 RepID=A0A9N9H4I3_9GLOM|nr:5553_t:CDS:2 [Racocetra fulgida]
MELQNVDPLSNSILPTTISLINGPALQQQPTCLTTSNININCINDESDEQSDNEFEEQLELYEAEEAYVIVESFAHSNGFGIRKGRVEKDSSNGREISRSFICRHAGKPSDKNKSYKTEESGSCRTDCKWKVQDNDEAFVDNAFDYPLAHSFALFKEVEDKVVESLIPTTILRSNESANLFSAQNAMSTMTRLSTSVVAKKAMQKKKVYAETIGIARKAINIAIEKDDPHVLKFLKGYILQNERSLVENTTEASSSGYKTNVLKERPEVNIIPEKSQVSNPVKKARKGRPPKIARYQSSLENPSSKAQEKRPRGPGTNTCGECGGKGHNRRWHSKHENKSYDSGIICELCGGCGHKKELHNHDLIEENENEWVGSSGSESGAEMDNIE